MEWEIGNIGNYYGSRTQYLVVIEYDFALDMLCRECRISCRLIEPSDDAYPWIWHDPTLAANDSAEEKQDPGCEGKPNTRTDMSRTDWDDFGLCHKIEDKIEYECEHR